MTLREYVDSLRNKTVAVLGGMALGLAWIAMLVVAFIFFGIEGFVLVKEWIKSFL